MDKLEQDLQRFREILDRACTATLGYDSTEVATHLEKVLDEAEARLRILRERERIARGFPETLDDQQEDEVSDAVEATPDGKFIDNVRDTVSYAAHLAGVVWTLKFHTPVIDWEWERREET